MQIDRALEIAARARMRRPKKPRRRAGAAQLDETTLPGERAPSDERTAASTPDIRDTRGHYLPGWRGGPGRPKGSRNRLTEAFLDDLLAEWQKHGRKAIRRLCEQSPVAYMRVMARVANALRVEVTKD